MNISYWEKTSFFGDYDYTIVGSGIVGLFASLRLKEKEPDAKICILERGMLPSGASTKNAGFACFGSLSELIEQLKKGSESELVELVAKRWLGLEKLIRLLGKDAIDFQNHGGYELFTEEQSELYKECTNRMNYFNQLFKNLITPFDSTPIYSLCDEKINVFGFKKTEHLIFNAFEGQIDTGKMMKTLLKKVLASEINILNNVSVTDLKNEGSSVHIITPQFRLKAKKVLIATNAFAKQLFPHLDLVPGRGQVLITKPIKKLSVKGTFHLDRGYFYFRNIHDRILLGGGRNLNYKEEETFEFGETELVQKKLAQVLREIILPNTPHEIDFTWSGIMGFGTELCPIIQSVEKNIFCGVRCNGMGVAMGSLIGEELADLAMNS